ncbi:MAG: sigma-70 family RNA polymerase sigma factor [Candidatus Dormibacteria bacterium]
MATGTDPAKAPDEVLSELAQLQRLVAEYPPLDGVATAALLSEVGDQGLDADPRRQLVQHHLWLVLDEAVSATAPGISTADLFQEGTTALLKLVHGLAPGTGLGPEEFLAQVRAAVATAIGATVEDEAQARERDQQWARDAERLFVIEAELRLESGESPTDTELASKLGWDQERVQQLRRAVAEASSQHDLELMESLGEMEEA